MCVLIRLYENLVKVCVTKTKAVNFGEIFSDIGQWPKQSLGKQIFGHVRIILNRIKYFLVNISRLYINWYRL